MPADKCYTKKNKNGGNYTTCVDKKGDQLREKDVKPKKKKRLYIKKPAVKTNADIPVANGNTYPSVSEYRLNGPASPPTGMFNVINVVIIVYYYFIIN